MSCSECERCKKIKDSDKVECSNPKYKWIITLELAKKQKLCDEKTNYRPKPLAEHVFGPQLLGDYVGEA